jgi:excisionase family DNA binding protein
MVDERLVTPPELAAWLRVSNQTLARWRASNHGPAWFYAGRAVRYHRADVESWIARRANRQARAGTDPRDRTADDEREVEQAYRDT